MALTYDGTNGITFNDGSKIASASSLGMRNKVHNGAMIIDQRGSASSTITTSKADNYIVDRFTVVNSPANTYFTAAQSLGSVTPPAGFTKYLGITSSGANSPAAGQQNALYHRIEGYNISDLAWGTLSASPVTVSFWVRSSVTGTYSFRLVDNSATATYVTTYTINSANTWEYKTITIPGSTSLGTWSSDNTTRLQLCWDLGSGSNYVTSSTNTWIAGDYTRTSGSVTLSATNAATFQITGVQLEKGSVATPFEYRPHGTELALCQRYYQKTYDTGVVPGTATTVGIAPIAFNGAGTINYTMMTLTTRMRAGASSISLWDAAGNSNAVSKYAGSAWSNNITASFTTANFGEANFAVSYNGTPFTTGLPHGIHYAVSAEL